MRYHKYFGIIIGAFLLALGLNLFLVPFRISPGGVSTIGTILLYFWGVPLSVTTLLLNAVLFLFGYKILGKSAVIKTIWGVIFSSLFLELCAYFPVYTEDVLMATLSGGILTGLGIGLAVRQEASTGGSDFAALMLHRFFPHISVSFFILFIDAVIILLAGVVFGSITVSFYSALTLFVSMKTTDLVLTFGDTAKSIFILSPKTEEISACVQARFSRGTTGIYSRGMYFGKDGLMLFCVVSPKELPALVRLVRSVDETAFIVISDAREVLGEGFKTDTGFDTPKNSKNGISR